MARYTDEDMAGVIAAAKGNGYTGAPTIGMKICAIIDAHARREGVPPKDLMAFVGIHPAIYHKWRRAKTQPSIRVLERLEAVGIRII